MKQNRYRTHTCGQLRTADEGSRVRLAGWVHRRRDHGGILFVDLRDHYGITQIVLEPGSATYDRAAELGQESVVRFDGEVRMRPAEMRNPAMETGDVEVAADAMEVLGPAAQPPFNLLDRNPIPEATRLQYRFLDLRRPELHERIVLRSRVISSVRRRMSEMGFLDLQTPIMTSSSPEGARDFLIPSRIYPGRFYALPQAPQQFKQLYMASGFDRYFQIAPCFRDEDARADRSPGEFYQIDFEMAFVEQEDVFAVAEQLMYGLFTEFSDWAVTEPPFPRIPYREAMARYGSDKPDLRFGLEIQDVSEVFRGSGFRIFAKAVESGKVVRALCVPDVADRPRSFFANLEKSVKEHGGKGLAHVVWSDGKLHGSIAGALDEATVERLVAATGASDGSALLLIADDEATASTLAGRLRLQLADELDLREKDAYRFCWIVDYPMYEYDEEAGKVEFSHNPFSMPQGGLEALDSEDPLDVLAFQYDIVCNGVELSSGAIRNHRPDIMYKAFAIAGHGPEVVDEKFGGMIRAFRYGAPPHGGLAPGLDRIVMLLCREANIREIIAFPMAQNAQDLLMGAPGRVSDRQLRELHLQLIAGEDEEAH